MEKLYLQKIIESYFLDENDNTPQFELKEYNAGIDEGETQFQPSLVVKATDVDLTSDLAYAIVDGNLNDLFTIDVETGEIMVKSRAGLRLDNIATDKISLRKGLGLKLEEILKSDYHVTVSFFVSYLFMRKATL